MKTCRNCGEEAAHTEMVFCPICGSEFPPEDTETSFGAESRNSQPSENGASGYDAGSVSNDGQEEHISDDNPVSRSPPTDNQPPAPDRKSAHQPSNTARNPQDGLPQRQSAANTERTPQSALVDDSASPVVVGGVNRPQSLPAVSDTLWSIAWMPKWTILAGTFLGAIFGLFIAYGADFEVVWTVFVLALIGLLVSIGIWYRGVAEVNENYGAFRDWFFSDSAEAAAKKLAISEEEALGTYHFLSPEVEVGSPPLIKCPEIYTASHMMLSDVSVSAEKGSLLSMRLRSETQSGTLKEIYYDNIENVNTNDQGGFTTLRIITSAGEDLTFRSFNQQVAEKAQQHLRKKMRDVRRTHRTRR